MGLKKTMIAFNEKRKDIVGLQIYQKNLEKSTRDVPLDQMKRATELLNIALARGIELGDQLGGPKGILLARKEVLDLMSDNEKMMLIDEHTDAVAEFKDASEKYSNAGSSSNDLVVVSQIRSHQEDRMKMASVKMAVSEDMFGNSSNLAEAKREIEERREIASSADMNQSTQQPEAAQGMKQ